MPRKVTMREGGIRIDSGEYKAVVTSLEEKFHEEYKENYLWKVKIKDPTFEGDDIEEDVELSFFTSRKLTTSSKNKLTNFVKAVMRKDNIDKGDEIDLDDLIGKPLRVVIKDKPSKDGGEIYSQVSDFLPLKKKKTDKEKEKDSSDEEKPKEKAKEKEEKSEKKEEKKSDDSDDSLFNFSDDD